MYCNQSPQEILGFEACAISHKTKTHKAAKSHHTHVQGTAASHLFNHLFAPRLWWEPLPLLGLGMATWANWRKSGIGSMAFFITLGPHRFHTGIRQRAVMFFEERDALTLAFVCALDRVKLP